jgi:putative flippase GtrA
MSSRLLWFAVAGGAGFLVDGGVLTGLIWLGCDPRPARLLSFLAAMVTTWLINRTHTFADRSGRPTLREFLRYAAASMFASSVNLGVYFALVSWGGPFRIWPVLALAIATGLAMVINFLSYLKVVFAPKP